MERFSNCSCNVCNEHTEKINYILYYLVLYIIMSGENTQDSVFSPLVNLSSKSLGSQVDRTTSGSQEVLKRIAEIDNEEKTSIKLC